MYHVRCIFLFGLVLGALSANVQFPFDTQQHTEQQLHCLDEQVEYNCTVSGSVVVWRILLDDGTQIGTDVIFTSSNQATDMTGQFTFQRLSLSPLLSSVSFTVQSSVDKHVIICQDFIYLDSENLTINIADIPPSPEGVTIHTNTFTNSSVSISWNESSPCVTGYRYNVLSTAIEENVMMESTSNSAVMVEGLVPSDSQYCVVVTAIDTANRNSSDSDPACFIFNVPPDPVIVSIASETESDTTDRITVNWTFSYNVSPSVAVPDFNFTVNIFNSTTDNGTEDIENGSRMLSPETRSYAFLGIPKDRNYTIKVVATNGIGSSSSTMFFQGNVFSLSSSSSPSSSPPVSTTHDQPPTPSTTTRSTLMRTSTSVVPTRTSSSSSPIAAVAGGVAAGVLVLLILVLVVVGTVVYCLQLFSNHRNKSEMESPLEMKVNSAYGQVNSTAPTTTQWSSSRTASTNPVDTPSSLEMKSNVAYGQVNYNDGQTTTASPMYETICT